MNKIKSNIDSLNKHLFLGFSFFIFSLIASVYWGLIYAETIPAHPTGLTYSVTASKVILTWTDNATNEDKFNISRRLSSGQTLVSGSSSTWTSIGLITTADTTTYTDDTYDTGATSGYYYDYSVEACLSGTGCSTAAVVERVFIPSTNTNGAGTACTDVQLKLNDNKTTYTVGDTINYTWVCSPSGSVANVYMFVRKTDGSTLSNNYINGTTTASSTYTGVVNTSNLIPGSYILNACLSTSCATTGSVTTGQNFTVVSPSYNSGGTTPVIVKDPTGLGVYGGVTLNSSFKSIPLSWIDNSDNEDRFSLQKRITGTTTWANLTIPTGQNLISFSDYSVTAGVHYDYRVQACLGNTCSGYSTLEDVHIPAVVVNDTITTPIAPAFLSKEILHTTAGLSNVKLTWKDNSDNEIRFIIKRKLNSETTFPSTYSSVNRNITDFLDTNYVKQGSTYDYSLSACSSDILCSDPVYLKGIYITSPAVVNPPVLNTPDDPVVSEKVNPPTPTELKKDSAYSIDTLSYIIIRWAYNFDNDVKFIVKRKLSNIATSVYLKIGETLKGINYFKDSTVKPTTLYDYSVTACDSTGLCSNQVEVKGISSPSYILTPPNAPTGLTKEINNLSTTFPTVTIRWKDNSLNEDKFILERKTNLNTTYTQLGEIIRSNITSYVDKITPGIYYEYRIKACTVNSCSTYSNLLDKVYIEKPVVIVEQPKDILYTDKIIEAPLKSAETATEVSDATNISNTEITAGDSYDMKMELSPVNIPEVLNVLSGADQKQTEEFKEEKSLIYKDTNSDGVSDYDSKYVYNIDPSKASPVSVYEGKSINASDKILLGFDPTKTELVKITKEEPLVSKAKVVSTYKVKEINLTDKKQISIKGQALPNSFITVYIYSTPIIVTIKTDSRGEWQYLLDKELENGDHTVYTATVNNTGNIVAQSSPYSFTKTAEAVTLKDIPVAEASSTDKPGLMSGKNIYIIPIALVMVIGITLILVGLFTKKESDVVA